MIKAETNKDFNLQDYQDKKIVFFDGVCNFCNKTVDLIWRNNSSRDIFYSSLQSNFASVFLLHLNVSNSDLDTLYYYDRGTLYNRSRAIGKILLNFDRGFFRISGKFLLWLPHQLADLFYNFFARNRYKITGKQASCRIPSAKEKAFFME